MLLVDERGVPLSFIVTGANRHDVTQLEPVMDAIVVRRPNICVWTQRLLASPQTKPFARGITPRMYARAGKKLANAPKARSRGAGWWK